MGRLRPTIGVTTSTRSGWRIFPLVAVNLWLAGARGVRWNTRREADTSRVDGLIVGGGDDISPTLYGGDLRVAARLDPDRDELEIRLVKEAMAAGKPVLGICRGAQMLNIALGGSLHQDAYAEYSDSRFVKTILPRKKVQDRIRQPHRVDCRRCADAGECAAYPIHRPHRVGTAGGRT